MYSCYDESNKEREHQDACEHGIDSPAFLLSFFSETPCEYKASQREKTEDGGGTDGKMDGPEQRRVDGRPIGRPRWIALSWISHEDPRDNESHSDGCKQNRTPRCASAGSQRLSESDRECNDQEAADDEIGDLLPSLVTLTQQADGLVPGVVARTSCPLNQVHDGEKERTDHATHEQKPGHQGLL